MNYNSNVHNRKSIRLPGYDYSRPGAYFITICTHNRYNLFGEITGGRMILNAFGRIAYTEWINTTKIRDNIHLDSFVIMPNHMHGIVIIKSNGADDGRPGWNNVGAPVGADCCPPMSVDHYDVGADRCPPLRGPSKTIGAIVRGFKASVTKQINELHDTPQRPVWQRNYYEHIIRTGPSFERISTYINSNPERWKTDKFYVVPPNE